MPDINFNLVEPMGEWKIEYTVHLRNEYKSFILTSDTMENVISIFEDDINRWRRINYLLNSAVLVHEGSRVSIMGQYLSYSQP